METDSVTKRKRKRDEIEYEPPASPATPSLLASPFNAIKSFFFTGNSSPSKVSAENNTTTQPTPPELSSPAAKRVKKLDQPGFITSSPRSPKGNVSSYMKPKPILTPAGVSAVAKQTPTSPSAAPALKAPGSSSGSRARRSLTPQFLAESEKSKTVPLAPSASENTTVPSTAQVDASVPARSTRSQSKSKPFTKSKSSTLLNLFSPVLNMFGGTGAAAEADSDTMDVDEEDGDNNNDISPEDLVATSPVLASPRRSRRLQRAVLTASTVAPVSRTTRSKKSAAAAAATTTAAATTSKAARRAAVTSSTPVRSSPRTKRQPHTAEDAQGSASVSSVSARRRISVRKGTTPLEPATETTTTVITTTRTTRIAAEDSLVPEEMKNSASTISVSVTRRAATPQKETRKSTRRTRSADKESADVTQQAQLTRDALSSNEVLESSTSSTLSSKGGNAGVAVHVVRKSDHSISAVVDVNAESNNLNESTIDMDAVYDEVVEEIDRSFREIESTEGDIHRDEMEVAEEMKNSISSAIQAVEQELEEEEEQIEEEEFDSFVFIASLPPREELPALPLSPVMPPRSHSDKRLTVILDLDETLVHCSLQPIDDADLTFVVPFQGNEFNVFVRKRPHFQEFLDRVADLFDVAIFTASQQVYADRLLDILDPHRKWSRHRLFRDSCLNVVDNYLKDLTILGRDLARIVIVDNSPHVFGYQIDNGIPIVSWFDDREDKELLHLLPFLESLQHARDVRPMIREKFNLHARVEDSRAQLIAQRAFRLQQYQLQHNQHIQNSKRIEEVEDDDV